MALDMGVFTQTSLVSFKERHALPGWFLCGCYGITTHFSMWGRKPHGDHTIKA